MIFFCAAAFLASRSDVGADAEGARGAAVAPFCCDLNANLALTAAILAAASCFFLSSSDMPLATGEPLLDRMRFESCSSPSGGNGRFPPLLAISVLLLCCVS